MAKIELTVDGGRVSEDVEPRMLLVQLLRDEAKVLHQDRLRRQLGRLMGKRPVVGARRGGFAFDFIKNG